eukprot:SM000080S22907  [mRNA]  locus=s80:60721:62075:+ [translate_table: standard]
MAAAVCGAALQRSPGAALAIAAAARGTPKLLRPTVLAATAACCGRGLALEASHASRLPRSSGSLFSCRRRGGGRPVAAGRLPLRCRASAGAAVVDGHEQLLDAAKAGDLALVRELVESGRVDVNRPSAARSGWTALQLSCFYEHPEVASFLLQAGADTEIRNDSGNTALQFACIKGNVQCARLLLDAGADIEAESNDKGNCLDYAQEWGGEEITDFIVLWAAKSNIVGDV